MTKKKKPAPKKPAKKSLRRLPPAPPPFPADQIAFERARAAYQAGALGEASALAARAADLNPRRADILTLLAACWLKRGDQSRALEHAQRATELDPNNPTWWNGLGWLHLQMRQFADAKTAYLRAISADPNLAAAYYNLARAELALTETQAAADHLVQALSLKKDLAADARRELAPLASHPALAEWFPPAKPEKATKGKKKAKTAKKKR